MGRMMNLYVGRSGQAAVMAEFLIRGYNVATPEVDRGDDLFVVQDESGDLFRIQVKTANAKHKKQGGYTAAFNVPLKQLQRVSRPDIDYAFAVRREDRWSDFIMVRRAELHNLYDASSVGSLSDGKVVFSLSFTSDTVSCGGESFQSFRNNWKRWPTIDH